MPFEVNASERANADIASIVDYWTEIDPDVAARIHQGIIEHFEALRTNPYVGEIVKTTRAGAFRESFFRSYRIFFNVDESTSSVLVIRVRHVKRRSLRSLE